MSGERNRRSAVAETFAGMRAEDPIGFWLSITSVATSFVAVVVALVALAVGA